MLSSCLINPVYGNPTDFHLRSEFFISIFYVGARNLEEHCHWLMGLSSNGNNKNDSENTAKDQVKASITSWVSEKPWRDNLTSAGRQLPPL